MVTCTKNVWLKDSVCHAHKGQDSKSCVLKEKFQFAIPNFLPEKYTHFQETLALSKRDVIQLKFMWYTFLRMHIHIDMRYSCSDN